MNIQFKMVIVAVHELYCQVVHNLVHEPSGSWSFVIHGLFMNPLVRELPFVVHGSFMITVHEL